MLSTINTTKNTAQQTDKLVAKLRHRQLDLAQKGCVIESARIAVRVDQIRREAQLPAKH